MRPYSIDKSNDKIDVKLDRLRWLIISTIVVVLLKNQILGLFASFADICFNIKLLFLKLYNKIFN